MSKSLQIQDATANAEVYIQQLASMSEKKLEKKLRVVRAQMQLAIEQKNEAAYELLHIWEQQIILALCLKYELPEEHEKPDEIEGAIAHIETMQQKSEERIHILKELNNPETISKNIKKVHSENQLNLF